MYTHSSFRCIQSLLSFPLVRCFYFQKRRTRTSYISEDNLLCSYSASVGEFKCWVMRRAIHPQLQNFTNMVHSRVRFSLADSASHVRSCHLLCAREISWSITEACAFESHMKNNPSFRSHLELYISVLLHNDFKLIGPIETAH